MTKSAKDQTVQQLAELSNRMSRSVVAVIDAMAMRGAIKGEEMETIGQLRNQATQAIQLAESVLSDSSNDK